MPELPMRFHLLAPDVKCPACGAGLTFVRVRAYRDLYVCASSVCKRQVIHHRNKETQTCGYATITPWGRIWQVDRVQDARGEGEMSSVSTPPDRILTMKEAAERLGCPAEIVAQLVRETTLWGTKMDDGGWGIKESELQRFIEATQRAKEK